MSSAGEFGGISVLAVGKTADQVSGQATETRWLAIIHNKIAVFGSPSAVQQALLRYISNEAVDPAVIARLERIPSKDIAWSSIVLDPAILSSHLSLNGYEHNAVACLAMARELVFGVRF